MAQELRGDSMRKNYACMLILILFAFALFNIPNAKNYKKQSIMSNNTWMAHTLQSSHRGTLSQNLDNYVGSRMSMLNVEVENSDINGSVVIGGVSVVEIDNSTILSGMENMILLQDNAMLIIRNTTINSTQGMTYFYCYNNSQLIIEDSVSHTSITIYAFDNSSIRIVDSKIRVTLYEYGSASIEMDNVFEAGIEGAELYNSSSLYIYNCNGVLDAYCEILITDHANMNIINTSFGYEVIVEAHSAATITIFDSQVLASGYMELYDEARMTAQNVDVRSYDIYIYNNSMMNSTETKAEVIDVADNSAVYLYNPNISILSVSDEATAYVEGGNISNVLLASYIDGAAYYRFGPTAIINSSTVGMIDAETADVVKILNSNVDTLFYYYVFTGSVVVNSSNISYTSYYYSADWSTSTVNNTTLITNIFIVYNATDATIVDKDEAMIFLISVESCYVENVNSTTLYAMSSNATINRSEDVCVVSKKSQVRILSLIHI